MRGLLHELFCNASSDYRRDLIQNCDCFPAVFESDAHFTCRGVEDSVNQMPEDIPSKATSESGPAKVNHILVADWPIQFRFQGMQQQIHFIKQERPVFKKLQDLGPVVDFLRFDISLHKFHLIPEPSRNRRQRECIQYVGGSSFSTSFSKFLLLQDLHHFHEL